VQTLRLLIVDDEPIILRGLRHMVERARTVFSEIRTASDAYQALDVINDFTPDLVITDIQMPEMDGLEFITQARQRHPCRFVILTGYDLFDYARQALRLHVNDFLLKPVQHPELVEVLNRTALEILEEHKRAPAAPGEGDAAGPAGSTAVRKFWAYVQSHFMFDISLDDVASHLKLHPNYVCAIIKKETGKTFLQLLQSIRIEKAKDLLLHPDELTIEQVAKSVGYENARNFYKVFKELEGTTPGEFRAQGNGDGPAPSLRMDT
jgi:two-component system response regulator YesN